jgi:hypothetical protein
MENRILKIDTLKAIQNILNIRWAGLGWAGPTNWAGLSHKRVGLISAQQNLSF